MRRVIVLGSTGSIGTQALEVIAANSNQLDSDGDWLGDTCDVDDDNDA